MVQVLLITSALGKQTKKRSVHSADTSRWTPFGLSRSYTCAIRPSEYGAAFKRLTPPSSKMSKYSMTCNGRRWMGGIKSSSSGIRKPSIMVHYNSAVVEARWPDVSEATIICSRWLLQEPDISKIWSQWFPTILIWSSCLETTWRCNTDLESALRGTPTSLPEPMVHDQSPSSFSQLRHLVV